MLVPAGEMCRPTQLESFLGDSGPVGNNLGENGAGADVDVLGRAIGQSSAVGEKPHMDFRFLAMTGPVDSEYDPKRVNLSQDTTPEAPSRLPTPLR
jgi:hypothetical protein